MTVPRYRWRAWMAVCAVVLSVAWLLGGGLLQGEPSAPSFGAPGGTHGSPVQPSRSLADVHSVSGGGLRASRVKGDAAHADEFVPDLLQEVLDGSRLQADWLASRGFTPNSDALRRLHALLDGHVSLLSGQAIPLAFGPREGISLLAPGSVPVLAAQERYVHALMPAQGWGGDSVLVRWRNVSDNTVMEVATQAIGASGGEGVPLWQFATEDWSPGRYRVEVISSGVDLSLLAAGEFEIAAPGMHVTPFALTATAVDAP